LSTLYNGRIRLGKFNELSPSNETVLKCDSCHVAFLLTENFKYDSDEYRLAVEGEASPSSYYKTHDSEQSEKILALGTGGVRGKTVADIGCGAGAFLDFFALVAERTIAVEPCQTFHSELRKKGHTVFSSTSDAVSSCREKMDIVTCFAVIEHVPDPVHLLQEIRELLKPGGLFVMSTPNSSDWLLQLIPEYRSFFYRRAHSFYFNDSSLRIALEKAFFSNIKIKFKQQYDISNSLTWIRDRVPGGNAKWPFLNALDPLFRNHLEQTGMSNFLYATAERA